MWKAGIDSPSKPERFTLSMPVPSMETTMNRPTGWAAFLLVLVFGGFAETKAEVPKDIMVLTGSPLGGVRFEHKLHVTRAGNNCATCHHPSRPEKAASAPQQACSDCHTKVAAAPMKTKHQAAFHDPMAQSGLCIDCHKADKAKPKKAPLGCMDCHKKENK